MPGQRKKRGGRKRQSLSATAGNVTFQYAFADNVDQYTTINITTSAIGLPNDRPLRIRWVSLEYSCAPDATPSSAAHVPLIQFEVCAPSGVAIPRVLYRTRPCLVPSGVIKRLRINVPNAGFFLYDTANTIVLKMIVSASAGLAVTGNVFLNAALDFKSYQGLSSPSVPMLTLNH